MPVEKIQFVDKPIEIEIIKEVTLAYISRQPGIRVDDIILI